MLTHQSLTTFSGTIWTFSVLSCKTGFIFFSKPKIKTDFLIMKWSNFWNWSWRKNFWAQKVSKITQNSWKWSSGMDSLNINIFKTCKTNKKSQQTRKTPLKLMILLNRNLQHPKHDPNCRISIREKM